MDAVATGGNLAAGAGKARSSASLLWLFSATLFLSALLLFSVQPMFAKMVLPKLGGSPSVWAVSMCFFQVMLLGGYCYAHAVNRYVPGRHAPMLHVGLLSLAALTLPIGLAVGWSEPPAGDAYVWLIGALALGVGLPFFAISANAPLLQAWFARTGHRHADDPYFLYGASNLGSLIALLGYPFLLEPTAGLVTQGRIWTAGFVALSIAIALCGAFMIARQNVALEPAASTAPRQGISAKPTTAQRLSWIGLAAVPSGLLVAYSSYVTTDIASAPFLWVIPLAIFLLTFILVFKETPVFRHDWLLAVQPVLVAVVLFGLSEPGDKGWMVAAIAGTAAFFVTTMVAHRELFERRPAAEHLTEFYLLMSLGGAVGGMFAALLAPKLFNVIWEFPLLLVLGMACRPGVLTAKLDRASWVRLAVLVGVGLVVIAALGATLSQGSIMAAKLPRTLLVTLLGLASVLAMRLPVQQFAYAVLMGAAIYCLPSAMNRGDAERSFFGVHRVAPSFDKQMQVLWHGTTIHGAQRLVDAEGRPLAEPVPATYYYPGGPMARGLDVARQISGKTAGGLSVGVVGLGAGSMACHSRSNERWRYFEIDPVVVRIASDPSRFTFLSRCRRGGEIVVGDARLTLTKEARAGFDYLIVDAFSSDSVPVHLMTVEALQLYLEKLSPNGILALHVSNRHLDLVDVLGAVVAKLPGVRAVLAEDRVKTTSFDKAPSRVVFLTRSDAAKGEIEKLPFATEMPAPTLAAWTDDYSDILGAILKQYQAPPTAKK